MSPSVTSGMSPKARRTMVTVCAMAATIMQALDTTIANVALPYMQGSLSASQDQINWVLTSYIVASAIMTAPIGWLADRFGRKKLFIVCVGGFTVASLLCATAQNIEQIVLYRLLQGMGGAALVPLSQAVLLDSYTVEERSGAMAIWGIGVMLGPIMGPTIGAWLTDNYSWHWVFLINLPIGVITVIGLMVFMAETEKHEHLRFDWFGFLALAVGIGSLQLLLDRGEQVGWFDANEIWIEAIISGVGFYYFFAHSLTTDEPFVRFELFKDANFVSGCVFMVVIGVVLFGTMALVTPFMQNLLGFPIQTAGFLLGSRGVGTLLTMLAAPRLMRLLETRYLILLGLLLTGGNEGLEQVAQPTGLQVRHHTTRRRLTLLPLHPLREELRGIGRRTVGHAAESTGGSPRPTASGPRPARPCGRRSGRPRRRPIGPRRPRRDRTSHAGAWG